MERCAWTERPARPTANYQLGGIVDNEDDGASGFNDQANGGSSFVVVLRRVILRLERSCMLQQVEMLSVNRGFQALKVQPPTSFNLSPVQSLGRMPPWC